MFKSIMAKSRGFGSVRHFAKVHYTFIDNTGTKTWKVEAEEGDTVMSGGVLVGVPFQQACGGNGECSTCHIYCNLDDMQSKEGYREPTDKEQDGLDFTQGFKQDKSRLACQMKVAKCCEGQVFEVVEDC